MLPLFNSEVVRQATIEMEHVQSLAFLGADAEPERPLIHDGLVASADGMFWSTFGD